MKEILTDQERSRLDHLVADAEKRTGTQIVLAVTGRSDEYPELPWKAFALGAAIAGMGAGLLDLLSGWTGKPSVLMTVMAMLGAGAVFALVCSSLPGLGRLVVDPDRVEAEARQYAQSLFLSRELFATGSRSGVLLLVSMFERKVVLLPDTGLKDRLSGEAMQGIIGRMTGALAKGEVFSAMENGLRGLEETLPAGAGGGSGKDELPNIIAGEAGP